MKQLFRWLIYTGSFILPILVLGGIGFLLSMKLLMADAPDAVRRAVVPQPAPAYDAQKPTVVIVLGDLSEVTDVLGPYALFAESARYNVYTVAATRALYPLTGGLDLVPHFSFVELDGLLGHSPDIVVLPNIPNIQLPVNQPLLAWLKQQKNERTILFSWCTGAQVLAEAGLLDGKAATTHWGDIDRLETLYPAVHWQRGVRYVDQGNLLTTAGVTSGIDATLHLLGRLHDQALVTRIAQSIHYPSLQFVEKPAMPQYQIGLADSIYLLNAAFAWPKQRTGVWLYDGVGEFDLAAAFDVYGSSSTDQAYSMAAQPSIHSLHGLQLIPRWQMPDLPTLDRLLVPGGMGVTQVASTLAAMPAQVGAPLTVLTNPTAPTFAIEVALEALAQTHNVPTARFTAKRLEYRAASLQLNGSTWPAWVLFVPLLLGGLGVGAAGWLRSAKRHQRRLTQRVATLQPGLDVTTTR